MKRIKKVVAVTGTYQKNGETKKQYTTIGAMFKREDGSVCIKLDTVPVGTVWDGWLNFYDIEEQSQQGQGQGQGQRQQSGGNGGWNPPADLDDEIPF
jgi:hypothetical protein